VKARNPISTFCSKTLGMYEKNCGLENVLMSFGHDEYLYQCLMHNKSTIPEEGLFCIR
jgi:inositol oxygenase